jgi:hypothetical protein
MRSLHRFALVAILVTVGCRLPATPPPQAQGGSCEYIGTQFTPPRGWTVKEESDGEPLARITLTGWSGDHEILASFFARETLKSAEPIPSAQARAYFQKFRAATADKGWTDIVEKSFEDGGRTYPALAYRDPQRGPMSVLDTQQDTVVLLVFPNDFPAGGYFYPLLLDRHPPRLGSDRIARGASATHPQFLGEVIVGGRPITGLRSALVASGLSGASSASSRAASRTAGPARRRDTTG